jgi:hypothetical protein
MPGNRAVPAAAKAAVPDATKSLRLMLRRLILGCIPAARHLI